MAERKPFNPRKQRTKSHSRGDMLQSKIALRRKVFDWIKPEDASVFDAFAGEGEMHRHVWAEAEHYVACDLLWHRDERMAFAADNLRVLRAINLEPFNVFDLDAFGCPYAQAIIIAGRRRVRAGEVIALCLTDGTGLALKMGKIAAPMRELTGMADRFESAKRSLHDLTTSALRELGRRMDAALVDRYEAISPTGARVVYTTAIYRGGA